MENSNVIWIQQQRPGRALGRAQIRQSAISQRALAGHFGKPAVAAERTAQGRDGATKLRDVVRPDHHLAAVAGGGGVSVECHAPADIGLGGVAHVGIGPMEVSANQNRAAAGRAGCIDTGAVEQADILAGYFDIAACPARIPRRGVDRAADENVAPALPLHLHVPRGELAALGDGDRVKVASSQDGGAATGVDSAGVGHAGSRQRGLGRPGRPGIHVDAAAVLAEQDLVARREADEAAGRDDGAGVGDRAADQRDKVAADGAGVAHFTGEAAEAVQSGQKILLGHGAADRIEPGDIDDCGLPKIDSRRVDEVNPAVGQERAVNLRRRESADQVEHPRLGSGLDELHRLAGPDIERPPV